MRDEKSRITHRVSPSQAGSHVRTRSPVLVVGEDRMRGEKQSPSGYRTDEADGIWFSLDPSLLPPDDEAGWLDLHRHQEEGAIVLGRFPGLAAAIEWAARHGVDPVAWRPDDEEG